MFETIIFFLTFYLLLISVIGYGLMFQNLCFAKINDMNDQKVIFTGFYGIFIITFISLITSLLVAHNFIHNILLHFIGILFFIFLNAKNKKNFLKIIFIISFFVISALLISKTHDDFSYYHLPFTKYLTEHKVIFGLGNLGHGYNFVSSLFFLNSTFYLPLIEFFTFHFTLIFFLIFFNFFLFKEILFEKNHEITKFLYLFAFAFFNLSFNRLAEFGTDKAGQILIVILIIKIFQHVCFDNDKFRVNNIIFLIPLLGLCISFKTYFLPYILFGLTILILDSKKTRNIKLIIYSKSFAFFFLFLVTYFAHHFISTGCLISPLSFTCFGDNFNWAGKNDYFKELSFFLEQWAKGGATPNFRVENPTEYVENLNWVSNWYSEYFFRKGLDQLGILISVFLIIFIFFKKLKYSNKKFVENNKILFFYSIIIIIFLIWFFKHPSLRYGGYSICFLLLSIPTALIFFKFDNKNFFKNKFKFIVVITVIIFNFKNIDRIDKELNRLDLYKFNNFPYFTIFEKKFIYEKYSSGLVIYKTNSHCWDTPTPCVANLNSKFKVEKKNGYYFISNNY